MADARSDRRIVLTDRGRVVPNAVVAEALDRFHDCLEAEEEQRKAILGAKNFRAGNQWPTEVREQRQGAPAIAGLAAQPYVSPLDAPGAELLPCSA